MADERIALRRTADGLLDDVVVRQVSMFRAETLGSDRLWLCCYLPATGMERNRVAFEVTAQGGKMEFEVVEMPEGSTSVEPSSP